MYWWYSMLRGKHLIMEAIPQAARVRVYRAAHASRLGRVCSDIQQIPTRTEADVTVVEVMNTSKLHHERHPHAGETSWYKPSQEVAPHTIHHAIELKPLKI